MRIFISYASKNRDLVKKLAEDLNDLGHEVWFDRELSGGQQWWDEILQSIRRCDLFIFVLTQESLESQACKREYIYANQLYKRILPVLMADLTISVLPPELATIQFVDYREADKKAAIAFNRALNMLPPPQSLPEPLPIAPSAPVSPLSEIRAQIDSPSLTFDEQRLLVTKLSDYVKEPETANDARALLRHLRLREDLLAKIDKEISWVLRNGKKDEIVPRLLVGSSTIFSVAFAPDGILVATGDMDGNLQLWNAISGDQVGRLIGHKGIVLTVKFSQDGKNIITGSLDNSIRIWDVNRLIEVSRFDDDIHKLWSFDISVDNKYLLYLDSEYDKNAEGNDFGLARCWDIQNRKMVMSIVPLGEYGRKVEFSSDNALALIAGVGGLYIVETVSWTVVQEIKYEGILDATFSPDSKYIAIGVKSNSDFYGVVFSVDSGELVRQLHEKKSKIKTTKQASVDNLEQNIMKPNTHHIVFHPHREEIITLSSDNLIRRFTFRESPIDHGGFEIIGFGENCIAISPDGDYILSGHDPISARIGPTSPTAFIFKRILDSDHLNN